MHKNTNNLLKLFTVELDITGQCIQHTVAWGIRISAGVGGGGGGAHIVPCSKNPSCQRVLPDKHPGL